MKPLIILLVSMLSVSAQWPIPKAPAVPEADGYVAIPNAAFAPTRNSAYLPGSDVQLAADALLVLMQYQNKGYALMSL